jgi:outer membrane protein assembly factor BamB
VGLLSSDRAVELFIVPVRMTRAAISTWRAKTQLALNGNLVVHFRGPGVVPGVLRRLDERATCHVDCAGGLDRIPGREEEMKSIIYAALLSAVCPLAAFSQTADEIKTAEKTPQHVLTYGMSYNHQRYSPLSQINRNTVKRLVPVWSYSLNNNTGEESQPLIYNGIMYVTSQNKTVAVDALTGKEIWNTPVEYPSDTTRVVCCGIVNRGAAIYEGKVFRTTLDARVIALDMRTGKEVWSVKSGDAKDGIAMTGAPLIANGVLITGMAGAEYGSRGYIEGYDPNDGKRLWRRYTVPRPGEPGADTWPDNAANASGGSSWTTGAYDPELDLVFWGIGNPAPWNALLRKGDNLFTNSILAVRPKTGEVVWHYQMSPNDPFDHDNITAIVLGELTINGKPTKVLLQAARNGFFYVLDRKSGQLMDRDDQEGRGLYRRDRNLAAHHRRHQLVPILVQPAYRVGLRQHGRLWHEVQAGSDRRNQEPQTRRVPSCCENHAHLQ